MLSRVEKFEAALAQTECDAVLVTNLKNIYYLTGFSGTEATVFISKTRRIFLTDARYTLIAKGVVQGFDIVETRDPLGEIAKIIADDKLQKIGFEDEISYAYFKMLESVFSAYELIPMTGFIENIQEALKVDEEVQVQVVDLDEFTGKASLSIRTLGEEKHQFPRRRRFSSDRFNYGFAPLKRMMPIWTKEALQHLKNQKH